MRKEKICCSTVTSATVTNDSLGPEMLGLKDQNNELKDAMKVQINERNCRAG